MPSPSEIRRNLESLRRRRDLLKARVASYVGGDIHPTRRELRALHWAIEQLEGRREGEDGMKIAVEGGSERTLENIMRCCQLHEVIEVVYVVDGYIASLLTRDGDLRAVAARGETAPEALTRLDDALKHETVESVRAKIEETEIPSPSEE